MLDKVVLGPVFLEGYHSIDDLFSQLIISGLFHGSICNPSAKGVGPTAHPQ
jgi:hypothetical protein